MRPLHCSRQLAITLGLLFVWYALFRIPIALLYADPPDGPIDTCVANTALANTAPNVVLYEIDRLHKPAAHRLVVVGSSNSMLSLRPDDLREALPGWEIANLSIPTSNVHQALQVVTLATSVSDKKTLRNTVFVLGVYPGLFARSRSLWRGHGSPLTREMLRYGLYQGSIEHDPSPVFGYRMAWLTKDLFRTVLAADLVAEAAEANALLVGEGKPPELQQFLVARHHLCGFRKRPPNAKTRTKEIARRARQIGTEGTLDDEQFDELALLVRTVRASGARLVITEMTVPRWMRLEHYLFYRERKQAFVRNLARQARVEYVDLEDVIPDELMGDSTHPMREGARIYAKAFAERIRASVASRK